MSSLDLNRLVKEADLLKVTADILEGSDSNASTLCYKALLQVEEMKEGLQALKTLVAKHKDQIEICKELLATVHHTERLTEHIENNLPLRYLFSTADEASPPKVSEGKPEYLSSNPGSWADISPDYCPSSSKKHVARSPRPYIMCLKVEEFHNIPKYMKGRLTYEMVNSFIDAFNMTLQKKYQLFGRPRNTLKGKKLTAYDTFKKQETKETIEKGIYFCVADDLKTLGNMKMDKSSYNMLNILRNTQRMREIRTPGITRFAVSN